ncbi:MAG: GGDEF domain-containing protein [Steroidobacteraceae bacterium]
MGTDGDTKEVARQVVVSSASAESSPVCADVATCQKCINDNRVIQCDGPGDRLLTLIPIRGEREVAGVLIVDAKEGLPPRDAELVHGILQIAKNHLALLDYGERDTLTGLLNRKTFESRFEKQRRQIAVLEQNGNASESSWLALIDIDRFKSINDTYGHLFGDEVLLLISQHMKRCFRGADHLFRFGGEEFLVILDQASDTGAQIALERLRATIEAHSFPQVGRVTVSLGFTRIDKADTPSNSVERADAALYYAKAHGRNNLQNFEALVAAGELTVKRASDNVELF